MKIIHWLKWIAITIFLLLFVPIGVENLLEGLEYSASNEEYLSDKNNTVLENPNGFNRRYHLQLGGNLLTFYKLPDYESKLRTVYDNYGIQLYFVEYVMDYNNQNKTISESLLEVTDYIKENELLDPYGLYYVIAEYDAPLISDSDYDSSSKHWETEVNGLLIYGDYVDKWWTTEVQKEFERVASSYEYRLGSWNDYETFISVMSDLRIAGNYTTIVPNKNITLGSVAVFILFSVAPVGIAVIILAGDIKLYKKKKQQEIDEREALEAEETRRILSTPIKTLEKEHAESLIDKYN